jgi:DNA-binding transcriptional LysR family regulator
MEWRFRASGREQVVRLTPRFVATDVETVLLAVKAGSGITRTLSYQVADDFSSEALVRPTARHMPRPVRAFLDVAAPALDALRVIHVERP